MHEKRGSTPTTTMIRESAATAEASMKIESHDTPDIVVSDYRPKKFRAVVVIAAFICKAKE